MTEPCSPGLRPRNDRSTRLTAIRATNLGSATNQGRRAPMLRNAQIGQNMLQVPQVNLDRESISRGSSSSSRDSLQSSGSMNARYPAAPRERRNSVRPSTSSSATSSSAGSESSQRRTTSIARHRIEMVPKVQVRRRASPPRQSQFQSAGLSVLNDSPLKSLKCIPDSYFEGPSRFNLDEEISRQSIDNYRSSLEFLAVEQASMFGDELLKKPEEDQPDGKQLLLDLDSEEGQSLCKEYLSCIERLFQVVEAPTQPRLYRDTFSTSYKLLYANQSVDNPLGYLTDILDSAQEGFEHLWVNGEKYVFSEHIIENGATMFKTFRVLKEHLHEMNAEVKGAALKAGKLEELKRELFQLLIDFDKSWTTYEQSYVSELMVIENDARRFIFEAIEIEEQIAEMDTQGIEKDAIEYAEMRTDFLSKLGAVNSVANTEGKGGSQFSAIALSQVEKLIKRDDLPKAVNSICKKVKTSYTAFRDLIRKYALNVESIDPQLKNNSELVQVLCKVEEAWTLATNQISSLAKLEQLVEFTWVLEETCSKFKDFSEQVECRDASIFVSLPSLLVLKALLPNSSLPTAICERFLPGFWELERVKKLKSVLSKRANVDEIEKRVLDLETSSSRQVNAIGQGITHVGIELSRRDPTEWNEFMTACLEGQEEE